MATRKSYIDYVGTGSQTLFPIDFPYISKSHVYATVNGVSTTIGFASEGVVQISPAPTSGAAVHIYRNTPADQLSVFPAGSLIRGEDLTKGLSQSVYISQEALDTVADTEDASSSAAAAASSAVSAAASAVSAAASASRVFDTVADVVASSIPSSVSSISIRGYSSVNDGGEWPLAVRTTSPPSHSGKIQSADGAWWVIVSNTLNPRMFGARAITETGYATYDSRAAIQVALDILKNPPETSIPGNWNYKRNQFRGRTLDLAGGVYLVSGPLDFQLAQGITIQNGTIIADASSSLWTGLMETDPETAVLTNKGGRVTNLSLRNVTIECNEVTNGIYLDRPIHGSVVDVEVFGFWNKSFGIKVDNSTNPGATYASNLVLVNPKTYGLIGGDNAILSKMPTATGILMRNGDCQIIGGECNRVLVGIDWTADGIVNNFHFSPYKVGLPAAAAVTNGSVTCTVNVGSTGVVIRPYDSLWFDNDTSRTYTAVAVSGATVTLDTAFLGPTATEVATVYGAHDIVGFQAVPAAGNSVNHQINNCYFDHTIARVHPRYKHFVGNQFRHTSIYGKYAVVLESLQPNEVVHAFTFVGNFVDLRRGIQCFVRNGSFASETTRTNIANNTVMNDTGQLPLGFTPVVETDTVTNGNIRFPATRLPSSNVNTLDDYREGTWTPTLTDGTNTCTASSATGSYTRVGNLVFASGQITLSSVNGVTGNLYIGGLPFQINAAVLGGSINQASGMALVSSTAITLYGNSGDNKAYLQRAASPAGTLTVTGAHLTASSSFKFSLVYFTS